MEAMGGIPGVDLISGLQSPAKTMGEAWVALFGWIHGVELVFVSKRGSSSTIRGTSLPLKRISTRRRRKLRLRNSSRCYIA